MGQTCCSADRPEDFQGTEPESKPERRKNKRSDRPVSSDDDGSSSDDDYGSDAGAENSASTSQITIETQSQKTNDTILRGFKDAVQSGNDSLAIFYIDENPHLNLMELKFENGFSALQVAVKVKAYRLVVFLLNSGISPNEQNQDGETALHTAVRTRDIKVVTLLSKFGADAKITNKKFETPIAIATDNNDDDIVELLSDDAQDFIRDRLASASPPPMNPKTSTINSEQLHDDADFILETDDEEDDEEQFRQALKPKINNITTKTAKLGPSPPTPLESNLDENTQLQLQAIKLKQSNPFSKLKRNNTKRALEQIQKIADAKDNLPVLEAWLEKKQSSMPYNWQKRWTIAKGSHLLWSDIQRNIKDPKNAQERKKFNNSINLMTVQEVKAVTAGKTQRKFTIVVSTSGIKNKRKEYLWKCATKEDRDYWVKGLNKHIAHMKSVISYLGTK